MPAPERITRRNLPHWYVPGAMHFVTYRLAGTIPLDVLARLREQRAQALRAKPAEGAADHRAGAHKRFFAAYDHYLDNTCRIDWLAKPKVAALVRGNLHHHNGRKYRLLTYCVMPTHVHVLFQPLDTDSGAGATTEGFSDEAPDGLSPLAGIMHSLKSYTAHKANELLGRTGCGRHFTC